MKIEHAQFRQAILPVAVSAQDVREIALGTEMLIVAEEWCAVSRHGRIGLACMLGNAKDRAIIWIRATPGDRLSPSDGLRQPAARALTVRRSAAGLSCDASDLSGLALA